MPIMSEPTDRREVRLSTCVSPAEAEEIREEAWRRRQRLSVMLRELALREAREAQPAA